MKPSTLPAHHTQLGFTNIHQNSRHGFGALLRWRLGLGPGETGPVPAEDLEPYRPAAVRPDAIKIHKPDTNTIQITWIGHSTFLIQVMGRNILTDPVFSARISPFPLIGPERQAPMPVELRDLPAVDAVVISHDHYDHLDKPAIKHLGNKPTYFVPLNMGKWLNGLGITNTVELDWWESAETGPLRFRAVPAQHFSGRKPFRFNRTLWAGWVIETAMGNVYFAGDTGYSPHFREIAGRVGKIEVALLPIGAYRPRWFMDSMHMDPPDAVRAFRDLEAEHAVGMHWGTFRQSDEPLAEPPVFLNRVVQSEGIGEGRFIVLKFGETGEFRNGAKESRKTTVLFP